jgi:hypothetical protein
MPSPEAAQPGDLKCANCERLGSTLVALQEAHARLIAKWRTYYGWNMHARSAFSQAAEELAALSSPQEPTKEQAR